MGLHGTNGSMWQQAPGDPHISVFPLQVPCAVPFLLPRKSPRWKQPRFLPGATFTLTHTTCFLTPCSTEDRICLPHIVNNRSFSNLLFPCNTNCSLFASFLHFTVCMLLGWHMWVSQHICGSQTTLESFPYFHLCMGSGDGIQPVRFGQQEPLVAEPSC